MLGRNFKAVIIDLDELVAQKMDQHIRAWKIAFDEYLNQNKQIDFDLKNDFSDYIENNPGEDSVKNFLDLNKIALPEGNPDSVEANTINGLINKGKAVFLDLIAREGVNTFHDSINQVKRWKAKGLKVAVISNEANTLELVNHAGVEDLLDVVFAKLTVDKLNQEKPSVKAYSYICNQLSVSPEETVLIENSIDGVKAGRELNFGLVVGMVRDSKPKRELLENGADIVVGNMEELKTIGRKNTYNYEIR